ncbi:MULTISPECIES: hypothetical protein [Streptomyces]|uniref:Uncharacterized protein n=1 Tax=Streptomyces dengpaensis TaxID=2049881 RepID=A0ABM6T422_9ACTN|nr:MULTISPECIES: hypothetical protein [Streptomyces]AVH61854.1 hypothetical protein C4B68_40830 [Streptomyces dengpaensis]PIB04530.1 hypothetical protein B1C81_32645 [Streptomyces sp. HG99]
MKLPFVRRTTADALRDKLTRAEEEVVAQAASVEAKDGEVQRLTGELNVARLARKAAQEAYKVADSRATRAEERVAELEARPRMVQEQPDAGEAGKAGPGPEDRAYAFTVLNRALPQFADIVTQNGGALPDENYEALSIYVNGASMYYGLSDAEVEEVGVRHGIPAPILQKAKGFVSRALPAGAV